MSPEKKSTFGNSLLLIKYSSFNAASSNSKAKSIIFLSSFASISE